jgi:LPS-assembly protein
MRNTRWTATVQAAAIALAAAGTTWSIISSADAQTAQGAAQAGEPPARRGGIGRSDASGAPVPVVFSADEVTYDDPLGIIIARGNVEITQGGETVLADVVSYNQHTDTVTASGHVTILRNTGETVSAEYADLTDQLNDGFIRDIRIMLADRSRLAGNTARRTGDGNRTEIRKGVYSPCDLCKDDPNAPPLFQIRADTIIENKEQQLIEYRDAELDFDGFPFLYSPYLSHPDPTVKRRSGLLPPTLGESGFLGAFAKIPYYFVLDDSTDFTFEPTFTTSQGAVADGEFRERFANGEIDVQASVTNGQVVSGANPPVTSTNQVRGNIDATGIFDLDEQFRTGFTLDRVTDQTYLELYRLGGIQPFLTSRGFLEDFDGRDYGVINAYNFQSLQANVSDRTQPIVLPSVEYTWAGAPMPWGGKFTTSVSGVDILRETGSSAQRLSAGTEFSLPFAGPWGERFLFTAGLRGDSYQENGVQEQTILTSTVTNGITSFQLTPSGRSFTGQTGRVFPQIGLEWDYPLILSSPHSNLIVEPRIAAYAAPVGGNPSLIANNDSQMINFNDTDLFTRNRFTGFDLVDSGQRIDYGLQADWHFDSGQSLGFLTGQSYRFQNGSPFTGDNIRLSPDAPETPSGAGDGLVRPLSDYVGRLTYSPSPSLDLVYRYRFDQQDLRAQSQDIGVVTGTETVRLSTSLIELGNNLTDEETHRVQLGLALNVALNPYWTLTANATRDLAGDGALIASGFGVQYQDECVTFIANFTSNGTRFEDIQPSQAVVFTLVLKNLGMIGLPSIQTGNGL